MSDAKLMALELNDEEGRELLALLSGDADQRAQAERKVMSKVENGEAVELGSGALRDVLKRLVGERPEPVQDPAPEQEQPEAAPPAEEEVGIDISDIINHMRKRALETWKAEVQQRFLLDVLKGAHYLLHEADGKLLDEAKADIARAHNLLCAAVEVIGTRAISYQAVRFLTHELDTLNSLRAKASCEGSA